MGGIIGRLFREFSVTIAVAVLISGFVSLTLTPMLASRFIRPPGDVRHGKLFLATERGFTVIRERMDAGSPGRLTISRSRLQDRLSSWYSLCFSSS